MFKDTLKNGNLREVAIIIAGSLVIAATITFIQNGSLGDLASRALRALGVTNETELPLASSTTAYPDQEARATTLAEYKDVDPPSYLVYATTTNKIGGSTMYDLYLGEDKQNRLKLLHYKNRQRGATTTYPIHRIYPDTVATTAIIADFSSPTDAKIFSPWFGKEPASYSPTPTAGLLSENLITDDYMGKPILPEWLAVPPGCISYMGGDECSFTIKTPNPYNLPPATLTQNTGPYIWSRLDTPYEIYVTTDKKIVIRWAFGDAGVHSQTTSVWDTTANTITRMSTLGGQGQDVTGRGILTLNVLGRSYAYAYPGNTDDETNPLLKQEPFVGWRIYGSPLKSNCYSLAFHPTNLTNDTAPWLVEYRYGCDGETIGGLSAWYELNPNTDSLRALTGVLPR